MDGILRTVASGSAVLVLLSVNKHNAQTRTRLGETQRLRERLRDPETLTPGQAFIFDNHILDLLPVYLIRHFDM